MQELLVEKDGEVSLRPLFTRSCNPWPASTGRHRDLGHGHSYDLRRKLLPRISASGAVHLSPRQVGLALPSIQLYIEVAGDHA